MVTLKETVRLHIETQWNGAVVCGSGNVPPIRCVDPEEDAAKDAATLRDYSEVILVFNEHKIQRRKYQQNLLEDREWAVPITIRLEIESGNTKTLFDAVRNELERVFGVQVTGIDPGQWWDGPDNRTLTKGFYEARYTLYCPQYGQSVSSGWTGTGAATTGWESIIPKTDSTYDLGSSTKLWHNLYVDHILSDGAIELLPSGDLDDYLSVSTASNIPRLNVIGGSQLFLTTDSATAIEYDLYYDGSHYLQYYYHKASLYGRIFCTGPIRIHADNDWDDYWYFTTAANIASFLPVEDKTHLIGSAILSADNVYADDFTNTSPYQRDATALTHLRAITDVDETHLDYSSLPAWVRQVHRTTPGGPKDAYPPDNPNVFSVNRMAVLTWQAVQQLADNVDLITGGGSFFKYIHTEGQDDVVADMDDDTLTLVAGTNITITHDAPNDAITISAAGGGGSSDSFKTIHTDGQSDVVADSSTDTLTLVAGANVGITHDAGTDTITISAAGGGGTGLVFEDDFLTASTETGEVGALSWSFTNGSMVAANAEANHPGIITRRCGTTAAQVASFYPAAAGTTTRHLYSDWGESVYILAPVATNTDHTVRVGLTSDATSNTPVNGVYFERLNTDTNWFRVTRAASSQQRTDTGVAYAASWINLRMIKNGAQVDFYVNGALNGSNTTNIPADATGLLPFLQVIPSSTTARDVKLDYLSLTLAAPTR